MPVARNREHRMTLSNPVPNSSLIPRLKCEMSSRTNTLRRGVCSFGVIVDGTIVKVGALGREDTHARTLYRPTRGMAKCMKRQSAAACEQSYHSFLSSASHRSKRVGLNLPDVPWVGLRPGVMTGSHSQDGTISRLAASGQAPSLLACVCPLVQPGLLFPTKEVSEQTIGCKPPYPITTAGPVVSAHRRVASLEFHL